MKPGIKPSLTSERATALSQSESAGGPAAEEPAADAEGQPSAAKMNQQHPNTSRNLIGLSFSEAVDTLTTSAQQVTQADLISFQSILFTQQCLVNRLWLQFESDYTNIAFLC
jgi:hypothetical protein